MTARIYKPAKTAMQSGMANTKDWVLDFDLQEPRQVEPLMGWTGGTDTLSQVELDFPSAEAAVAYAYKNFSAALRMPDVQQQFAEQGATPGGWSPAKTGEFIRAESAKWAGVIKAAHVTVG